MKRIQRTLCLTAVLMAMPFTAHAGSLSLPAGCAYEGKPVAGASVEPALMEQITQKKSGLWNVFVSRTWKALSGDGDASAGQLQRLAAIQKEKPCTRIMISYPGLPLENATRQQCIAGEYDRFYTAYALKLRDYGIVKPIMRVGWEWDIKTNKNMSVERDITKASEFAACYRRIVSVMRAAYPQGDMVFDFNSSGQITREMLAAGYPGDDVVDIVSLEGYDNRVCTEQGRDPLDAECRWRRVQGFNDMVRDFARSHGKAMAFPEWGLWNDGAIGNENLLHIRRMCKYAKDPANNVAYYVYFQSANYPAASLTVNARALDVYTHECGINGWIAPSSP